MDAMFCAPAEVRRFWHERLVTFDANRFRYAMFVAPAKQFRFGHQIGIARNAIRFGNAMLVTPQFAFLDVSRG